MPKLSLIMESENNSLSDLAKFVDNLLGFMLTIGNKKIVPMFSAPGSLQLCREKDLQIIIAQCGKRLGYSRWSMSTQSKDRISQAGVREVLVEVTIFESGQRRQIEFQQTGRGEMN